MVARESPYNFAPGSLLARKYEVVAQVSARHSGELYRLSERSTGIERTAKFFAPELDPGNQCASRCAKKLHKLRHCDILVSYRTQETISVAGRDVTFLVADALFGTTLTALLDQSPKGRLGWFESLHLLKALAAGLAPVHLAGEAHGDLTADNVIVRRRGLGFDVKLLDLNPNLKPSVDAICDDVEALVALYQQMTGDQHKIKGKDKAPSVIDALFRKARSGKLWRDAADLSRDLEALPWT